MTIYPLARVRSMDRRLLPLAVTTIGSFMSILDTTIVNVALPNILRQFDARIESGQLVLTSYLIALAIVIPLSGFLGEKIGMKRLYILTLTCFTLGSALCGLAWNLQSLIVFRVIQGLGGGMLQPVGMAIVFSMITPLERARFMGFLGLPMLIAPILGPSFGGYLVEFLSWRAIFWINLPIGLLNIVLAIRLLKETPRVRSAAMDVWGFVFAAIAFPCILLGMTEGEDRGWLTPVPMALLATGAVTLVLFIR
ncbi:MAG: DHA2 family efflux MFS transporter permease subunit, partial [Dehalococcoidia bacterium]|nr:DHA2 family efflux MFS transporter permease subunit [Dehalococcoidia bacterium]